MGFLDKLFGREKDTASETAEVAAPVAETAQDATGDAVEESTGTVAELADPGEDDPAADPAGTGPSAA